jgi:hypothetical protein
MCVSAFYIANILWALYIKGEDDVMKKYLKRCPLRFSRKDCLLTISGTMGWPTRPKDTGQVANN